MAVYAVRQHGWHTDTVSVGRLLCLQTATTTAIVDIKGYVHRKWLDLNFSFFDAATVSCDNRV